MRIFFLTVLVLGYLNIQAQKKTLELTQGWEFKVDTSDAWHQTCIPGSVVDDITRSSLPIDPYFGDNEKIFRKFENHEFTYRCKFNVDKELYEMDCLQLVFHGIDTYADIFLNGEKILSVENMFRTYDVEIKSKVRLGENKLEIQLKSVINTAIPELQKLTYKLPADSDKGEKKTSIFTRKAPYQYGWDFAPRFALPSIWKTIELIGWKNASIESVFIKTDSLAPNQAFLSYSASIKSIKSQAVHFCINDFKDNKINIDTTIQLSSGNNIIKGHFPVDNPRLWFPNGVGIPYLYQITASIKKKKQELDQLKFEIGIRTIKLEQANDVEGESFRFLINGKYIFARGSNMVPTDMFPGRNDSSQIESLVKASADANFNMIRIWGGGLYGKDYLYQLCDKYGILLWQDFAFACSFYPLDEQKMINITAEARDNIIRLRNHPSLALWCGNNEIDEAWHNWGYQKAYAWSAEDSARIWQQYETLFKELLPSIVEKEDPGRSYISTSPRFGWGKPQSMTHGDSHYWGIWWGMQDFGMYRAKTGRFMSEFGFQALPNIETIQSFSTNADSLINEEMNWHQKHPTGFKTINEYLLRDFWIPNTLEDYIYLSQINQAQGLGIAFRAHRSQKKCDGSLFWQLNDCWPGISWSAIDYFGIPKALYYESKRCFQNQLPIFENVGDAIAIGVIFDTLDKNDSLFIHLYSSAGDLLWNQKYKLSSHSQRVIFVDTIPKANFISMEKKEKLILFATTTQCPSPQIYTFVPFNKIELELPTIKISYYSDQNNDMIQFTSNKPALFVHPEYDVKKVMQDDYFHLIPGKQYEFSLEKGNSLLNLRMLNTIEKN